MTPRSRAVSELLRPSLPPALARIRDDCTECGRCVGECAFLQRHGTPRVLASSFDGADPDSLGRSFECSQCGLCAAVCPEDLDPAALWLEMRREAVDRGFGDFPAHAPLLTYERLGTSRRFNLYRLPPDCRTVFFPGCSLSGTRPEGVHRIFSQLRAADPAVGIVFDCCMKPSRLLGREDFARSRFAEMHDWLVAQGVREVLVACPNCQVMFAEPGNGLGVRTVWEALAESGAAPALASGTVTVHDPCAVRNALPVQRAVRALLQRQGLTVEEMAHSGKTTVCCGRGGGVNLLHPPLAASWGALRKSEAAGRRIVTYCAGCTQALDGHTPTSHVVDVLFSPAETLAGKRRGASAPFTYLHRLRLKRTYKRKGRAHVIRERADAPTPQQGGGRPWKPLVLLALLVAAVFGVHGSGLTSYLEQERLRQAISGYGAWAPVLYVLLYAVAPVLFLPGLPITIAGGILFGPVWGVVYTSLGSTVGASLAFLVARYAARDWVAARLTGPKWQRLDEEVARNGWKVVAFTRLIPAFPFNLLNYAFGLTKVSFVHYVAASFVCMLPACVAFIVFSSSLLGLLRGRLSPSALLGVALIALVSLAPVVYRRGKGRHAVGSSHPW